MILTDENLDGRIVRALRADGWSVESVSVIARSIPDGEVLKLAEQLGAVLITEDKDFGEWVFKENVRTVGIVFLRYTNPEVLLIAARVVDLLRTVPLNELSKSFTTMTPHKTRSRSL